MTAETIPQKRRPSVGPVDEDRQAGDEAAAALDEIDRTGEHDVAAVAGAQRRLALLVVLPVIEPDRLLVALERTLVGDHQTGRDGDVVQQRVRAQHVGRTARRSFA